MEPALFLSRIEKAYGESMVYISELFFAGLG